MSRLQNEAAALRQVTDIVWISLSDLLRDYQPGSQPQPWTWHDEAADVDARICACCDQPGHYQQQLEEWLRGLGHVPQGIALGGDGRVWDGHHRVVAAFRLGFPGLPVENDLEDPVNNETSARAEGDWRTRAGSILLDPNGPDGNPLPTPLDRRWLWRIEGHLAVSGTTDEMRLLGRDLRQYLNETCEHHWGTYEGDQDIPRHRQCLWCCDVEWLDADPTKDRAVTRRSDAAEVAP